MKQPWIPFFRKIHLNIYMHLNSRYLQTSRLDPDVIISMVPAGVGLGAPFTGSPSRFFPFLLTPNRDILWLIRLRKLTLLEDLLSNNCCSSAALSMSMICTDWSISFKSLLRQSTIWALIESKYFMARIYILLSTSDILITFQPDCHIDVTNLREIFWWYST